MEIFSPEFKGKVGPSYGLLGKNRLHGWWSFTGGPR